MSRPGRSHGGTRMFATQEPCPKCSGLLSKTRLEGKLFCRNCWQYLEEIIEEKQSEA